MKTFHTQHLTISPETQIERMKDGRIPLLPISNLKAFLSKQHIERDHLYEEVATLVIDSISVEDDVNTAIKALNG